MFKLSQPTIIVVYELPRGDGAGEINIEEPSHNDEQPLGKYDYG